MNGLNPEEDSSNDRMKIKGKGLDKYLRTKGFSEDWVSGRAELKIEAGQREIGV